MKALFTTLALALCFTTFAQKEETTTLTVTIENIAGTEGRIQLGVFTEDTFMKAPPIHAGAKEITDNKVTFVFENVIPGTYGATSLHDLNGNGQMDFNGGMPAEDYGVSNNNMGIGFPNWEDAKFEVKAGVENNIVIRH